MWVSAICPFEGHIMKLLQSVFCGLNIKHFMLPSNAGFSVSVDRNPFSVTSEDTGIDAERCCSDSQNLILTLAGTA